VVNSLFDGASTHRTIYPLLDARSDPNIQKYDIPELQTFINGIKKDLTAVKNGIIYSYNNGSAEGSVNKIKVIKRIMYGRNSFELLKAKVLFGELFHVKFN